MITAEQVNVDAVLRSAAWITPGWWTMYVSSSTTSLRAGGTFTSSRKFHGGWSRQEFSRLWPNARSSKITWGSCTGRPKTWTVASGGLLIHALSARNLTRCYQGCSIQSLKWLTIPFSTFSASSSDWMLMRARAKRQQEPWRMPSKDQKDEVYVILHLYLKKLVEEVPWWT